ncbi:hypothetical protein R5R35_005150 [Gryllus longicercus]|uniref:Bromo domain-containing protein n=1 Tax=Gryllus longicercus TaxID=2509291 RepID=A0AAN9V803_9ORTH
MTSVQERLKLKRAQIDTWSIREQLCLASSVLRSGDQNWMSVSRSLKAFGDPGRPPDWFSQKSCAVQYSNLLENVETPKRKKRTDKGDSSVETPSESIVRRLTQERIEELKRLLNERRQTYAKLKEEVMLVKSGNADDKLSEMCQEIEEEKRQKERKAEAHERWLKEREEKKVELERAWKPPVAPASPHRRKHHPKIHRRNSSQSEPSSEAESALDSPLSEPLNVDVIGEETVQEATVEPEPSQTPTSPLLTSLLKSPSPAPASQGSSILHSAITSHRGASPTITSLLSSAPGVPGTGNMVTVAPPTTVSSSLKNLVSSAISSEQPHHQPPPHNPSPAAAITPVVTTAAPKIVAVRAVTTAAAPTTSKITSSVSASDSNEVQSSTQEVKIADSTSRDDDIEVLQVDSTHNSVDAHQMPIETKEELIEEVLIEEVVVNDDSVIESELLNSQISDVVVTTEQEDIKEKPNKDAEEIKLEEPFIEVSQSAEVETQKEDIKTEMVADVDSTSNSELPINVESTNVTEEKNNKDECIEAIIETNSQELVSEIVTEETSGVEVVPATEEELTSGAVAEVIEITDDQDTTIQTEVVDECGPCMQELEDMEVIILDKVQGLDEVQIVEDMKELECEVVEVVMGTQEKVDDEMKEDSGGLVNDSVKPEDVTSVESCSEVSDTIIECKSTEGVDDANKSKSGVSATAQAEENGDTVSEKVEEDVLNDDIPSVEEEVEEEDDKPESVSGVVSTENGYEIEDSSEPREIIVERSIIVEEVYEEEKVEEEGEEDPEKEELSEDVQQDVIVSTSDSPVELESSGVLDIKESENKDAEDIQVCEVEEKVVEEEDAKDVIEETEEVVDEDSPLQNTDLKEDKKQSMKEESTPECVESTPEYDVKKDLSNKEELKKDLKESQRAEKDIPPEPTETNDTHNKNPVPKETGRKEVTDDIKDDISTKEQKEPMDDDKNLPKADHESDDLPKDEGKVSNKDIPKRDLQKGIENSKKVTKEPHKKDVEKVNIKEKDVSKKENLKKDVQSPLKEMVKELNVKEIKKDTESKDSNKKEVQIVLSKDSVKNDVQLERDIKKPIPSKEIPKKETPKREIPANKKDLPVSKRDIPVSKKELYSAKKDLQVKEGPKEVPNKRELLRRDSKEDISKKEVLKRNITKEEKRESLKDDLRKKPHIREITKHLKKADNEAKGNDTIKPEPVAKVEKNKKESESLKEESKEVKRDKLGKDSSQKQEDKSKDEQPLKESKIIGNSTKLKSYGDEIKPTSIIEKKDGKELKEIEKSETVPKQESLEHSEEKPEKRPQLRSETPSTEDDKTNDAEPPKVIGRKRLAAVNVLDSVPNSPASTTDEEREYKSWKKSIMLLYGRLATHKYASLFLRPITDDQAPGYSSVVHRPIDLLTIKKNIETGVIRTTAEFQRDVMLMFLNSIMYNKSNHLVHKMAKQMQQEGMQHIQDFITTQMLVQVVGDGVPIRRETRTTEANKQRDILGNPSSVPNQDESESGQLHKRKRNAASDSSDRGFKKKKVDE